MLTGQVVGICPSARPTAAKTVTRGEGGISLMLGGSQEACPGLRLKPG